MDRADLLEKLRAEHARLEVTLAGLAEEQMVDPELPDGLSVKDTLAHLAVWDRRGTTWLSTAARGETPAIPAPGATWKDMNRLNEESYRENLGKSLQEVVAEHREAFGQLVKQLEGLTDEDWNREYRLRKGAKPTPVWKIAGWRYGHLVEHGEQVHKFAGRLGKSAGKRMQP